MASDVAQLALVVGTATAINANYKIANGGDATTVLVSSGVSFAGLSIFGGLTGRMDLAIAVAWVFLIGSVVMHGKPIFDNITNLTKQKPVHKTGIGKVVGGGATGNGASGRGGGGGGGGGV